MKRPETDYSRHLVHPVTLLSVSDGTHENIATMSWVAAVSTDPPANSGGREPKKILPSTHSRCAGVCDHGAV